MGLIQALMSVLLVSIAQLTLRHAMVTLPSVTEPVALARHLLCGGTGSLALMLGLLGYLASMVCWFFALHRLALSRACALLSLSYVLVWAAAVWLPGWHEPFRWRSLAGVLIIVSGILLIFLPQRASR